MSEENLIKEFKILQEKFEEIVEKLNKILPNNKNSASYYLTLEDLRNPLWPEAVDPSMICDVSSEEDKAERANSVLDLYIEEKIKNKKFLDFGCGEGHIVIAAEENKASFSIGYDIRDTFSQELKKSNPDSFTTNWEKVKENGPYDIILMYDVFDHLENESEIEVFNKIKEVLAPNGKFYVRMHPWTSRHGGHLYHECNKAFLHIALLDYELEDFLGKKVEVKVNKHFYPLRKYRDTISKTEFKIITENIVNQDLEPTIRDSQILEKIRRDYRFTDKPTFQLGLNFVDYILGK
jgi:SAM-dependent methyltransferase